MEITKQINELRKLRHNPNQQFYDDINKLINICFQENRLTDLISLYVLNAVGMSHQSRSEESAQNYQKVIKILEENPDNIEIKRLANRVLGSYYWNFCQYDQALECFMTALDLEEEDEVRLNIKHKIAMTYFKKSDYPRSIRYFEEVYQKRDSIKDLSFKAEFLTWYAIFLNETGYSDPSLKMAQEALEVNRLINNPNGIATNFNTIGLIHKALGYYDQALKYYHESEKYASLTNSSIQLANIYNNLSMVYKANNELDKAIEYCQLSITFRKKNSQIDLLVITLHNLINLYLHTSQIEKAEEILIELETLCNKINTAKTRTHYLISAVSIYLYKKDYQSAYEALNESLLITKNLGNRSLLTDVYVHFASYYEEVGDFQKALEYFKAAKNLAIEQGKSDEKKFIERLSMQHQLLMDRNNINNKINEEKIKAALAMSVTANHEINQPLMTIQGNLDLLINSFNQIQLSEKQLKYIEKISKSIDRISDVLQKFTRKSNVSFVDYMQDIQMVSFD